MDFWTNGRNSVHSSTVLFQKHKTLCESLWARLLNSVLWVFSEVFLELFLSLPFCEAEVLSFPEEREVQSLLYSQWNCLWPNKLCSHCLALNSVQSVLLYCLLGVVEAIKEINKQINILAQLHNWLTIGKGLLLRQYMPSLLLLSG